MTEHPLTDEIAKELSSWHLDILDPYLADDHRSDMRSAADWQLDQVIKWAQRNCWCWFEKSSQKKLLLLNLKKQCAHNNNNNDKRTTNACRRCCQGCQGCC